MRGNFKPARIRLIGLLLLFLITASGVFAYSAAKSHPAKLAISVETALKAIDFAAENDISIDSEFSANLRLSINFNRNRYYSPALGRFVSKDPIGFAADVNLYRYAANDPISLTDPWGYRPYGTGDVAGVRIGEEFGPSGAGYSFGKGLSLGGLLSSLFDFPMVCNPSNPANQVYNNMGASGSGKGGNNSYSGESSSPNGPDDPNWGNKKGGGKTGRKINSKRASKWRKELDDLKKDLNKAKTKSEKRVIQKKIYHARRKLKESEPHAIKGQGY
jgi:RHS repeat-associated protein